MLPSLGEHMPPAVLEPQGSSLLTQQVLEGCREMSHVLGGKATSQAGPFGPSLSLSKEPLSGKWLLLFLWLFSDQHLLLIILRPNPFCLSEPTPISEPCSPESGLGSTSEESGTNKHLSEVQLPPTLLQALGPPS